MKDIKMTKEMLDKAKAASSAEELTTIAKTYGIELEQRDAKELFTALGEGTQGELSESDLEKVAGGSWQRPSIRR